MTTLTTTEYLYRCEHGHQIASVHALDACPACVRGAPCDGRLTRYGPGSRLTQGEKAEA